MQTWIKRFHLGTIIGVLAAAYIGYHLAGTVKRNYDLQQQINQLNDQIAALKDEREQLQYKIKYYQTDAFKEKEARAKLGLQAPGEGVIILPHDDNGQKKDEESRPKRQKSNPQQWLDFLLGRS